MRFVYKYLKQTGLSLATFLSAVALLAPTAGAASPGSLSTWKTANPLPQNLSSTGSVVYNDYVYVMSGSSDAITMNPNTYYAKLNSDGSVGAWQTSASAIPYPLMGSGAVAYNGYVYLLGGDFSGSNLNKVFYAKLNSDGSVGAWQTSANTLPQVAGWPTAVTYNGYVYVMGGYGSALTGPPPTVEVRNSVYYAKLNSDGSVGTWSTALNTLPSGVVSAASVVRNGYVYVVGGVDSSNTAQSSVYYAKLNSDGSVGTWQTSANTLPQAVAWSTASNLDDYIYIMGGGDSSNTAQSSVYYAKLNSDGSVGTWNTAVNALPQGRSYASSVSANGHIYLIGGFDSDFTSYSTVYYASLASSPSSNKGAPSPDNTTPAAPNTGYGVSNRENPIIGLLAISAVVFTGAGLARLYHRKKSTKAD